MTVIVVIVLLAAFVLVVAGAMLVRSRHGELVEPPIVEAAPALEVEEAPPDLEALDLRDRPETVEAPEAVDAPPTPPEPEVLVRPRMRDRLGQARALFSGFVGSVLSRSSVDQETWDDLEEALIRADVGVGTTAAILDALRLRAKSQSIDDPAALLAALKDQLKDQLAIEPGSAGRALRLADGPGPSVWLFVGVNGVGKTTTIGKLGLRAAGEGHRVVMAAGDTFRAAASEQLETWADRVGADLVRGAEGGDPGSVVFDAVQRAAARGADLVLADTAGRLHTKVNLMQELQKVRRVADRDPGTVTEVLLVIDATTGQNGLTQAREFAEAVGVTGVVLTKLDGTAKGGIVLAIESQLGIPVKLVGVGESAADLVDFDPGEFVDALFPA